MVPAAAAVKPNAEAEETDVALPGGAMEGLAVPFPWVGAIVGLTVGTPEADGAD